MNPPLTMLQMVQLKRSIEDIVARSINPRPSHFKLDKDNESAPKPLIKKTVSEKPPSLSVPKNNVWLPKMQPARQGANDYCAVPSRNGDASQPFVGKVLSMASHIRPNIGITGVQFGSWSKN